MYKYSFLPNVRFSIFALENQKLKKENLQYKKDLGFNLPVAGSNCSLRQLLKTFKHKGDPRKTVVQLF